MAARREGPAHIRSTGARRPSSRFHSLLLFRCFFSFLLCSSLSFVASAPSIPEHISREGSWTEGSGFNQQAREGTTPRVFDRAPRRAGAAGNVGMRGNCVRSGVFNYVTTRARESHARRRLLRGVSCVGVRSSSTRRTYMYAYIITRYASALARNDACITKPSSIFPRGGGYFFS